MPQDWESPVTFAAPRGVPARESSELAAAYALRPLSTGEVLDRTFSIYRSRFWLFAGLASIAGSFNVILNALQLLVHHLVLLHHGFRIAMYETQGSTLVVMILILPVAAVVYAAVVYALCEVYLGREVTAKSALRATIGRWARYVGIALWHGWSAVWLIVLLALPAAILFGFGMARSNPTLAVLGGLLLFAAFTGGSVYGVIAYIRNSLGIPAALMEQTSVRASMRRSKTLAAGTKGRIFVVLLVAFALYLVAGAIESPMLFFIARAPREEHVLAQAMILLIGFVAGTLVSPVALIGLTLVYFDQRVRKEAFDLVMLLGPDAPAAVAIAETETFAAPRSASGDYSVETSGDAGTPIGNDGLV